MTRQDLLNEVIQETCVLVKQFGHPRLGTLSVSPEVASMLKALEAKPSVGESRSQAASESVAGGREVELAVVARKVSECTRCVLSQTRTQTVFGVGNPQADIVFVGEAPGFDEDRQGEPFVGKAGRLLTDIIVKGMKMSRKDVYICNVLKCRPPDNRDPNAEEVNRCEPYLIAQLSLILPKVICALGRHAAQTLLRSNESTGRLRGRWHNYQGIPLRVTYHPAYLLRSPSEKRKTWEDIQEVMKVLTGEVTPEI